MLAGGGRTKSYHSPVSDGMSVIPHQPRPDLLHVISTGHSRRTGLISGVGSTIQLAQDMGTGPQIDFQVEYTQKQMERQYNRDSLKHARRAIANAQQFGNDRAGREAEGFRAEQQQVAAEREDLQKFERFQQQPLLKIPKHPSRT